MIFTTPPGGFIELSMIDASSARESHTADLHSAAEFKLRKIMTA